MKFPKIIPGRRGHPQAMVDEIYSDYLRLRSLAKTAKLHGRTRQAMWDLFHARGLPMFARHFHEQLEYKGRKYTPAKDGYLRDTIFRDGSVKAFLHQRIWIERHGPIPPGWNVMFKDGNKRNCSPDNLFCAPIAQISALTATGENQFTKSARQRLGILVRNFETGKTTLTARMKL